MKYIGLKMLLPVACCLLPFLSFAQTLAPGAPGKDAQWATAGKQGVGTSANLESKVWFTLAQGVMTEVYYPDVTVANVHLLQFVVVNPKTKKVETEQDDAIHQIKVLRPDSLTFQQINTAKSGEWKITKTYATHPYGNSVWIDVQFETKLKDLQLYFFYDPSMKNSGMHDSATTYRFKSFAVSEKIKSLKLPPIKKPEKYVPEKDGKNIAAYFSATDSDVTSFLYFDVDVGESTSGFLGMSDGLTQLREKGFLTELYDFANNGNVVQMGRIVNPKRFTVALGFGKNVEEAHKEVFTPVKDKTGFKAILAEYEKGWADYIKTIRKVEPKYQAQFNMAAMQLKAHEDKTVRGANIASLSVPWGGGDNANENNIGGYHLIWSRDLYQVATAFMALGDKDAAIRALNFLFKVQQKPDGSFPQNSYLDGKPFWGSLQLDEVAYPLILAHELGLHDKETYEKHVKKAADFIVKNGPATPQERWEEEAGYSPSTIATEIAGLVCAAEIAKKNGDAQSANIYLKTADEWTANVEKWTVTTNGKYSKEPYYIRIAQNGKPDAGENIELNNGAGFFDEREIVDAGFLELVRLGIKSPDDKIIQNSVKVVDEVIRVKTPNGDGFYRYNNDGYGEMDDGRRWNWDGKYTGKGRLWALLSGERGQYEIADCGLRIADFKTQDSRLKTQDCLIKAKSRLDSMMKFANEGLMIPEQIWDKRDVPKNIDKQFIPELKFGEGTGSATPLAWSMAQFIRLAVNLQAGRNLDTPQVVYDRYVLGQKSEVRSQKSEAEFLERFLIRTGNGAFSAPTSYKNPQSPKVFIRKGDTETEMMFSYIGKEKSVQIVGDFSGWKPYDLMKFQYFNDYSVKFLKFPNTARVEYKLIVDGQWITDPLNPNKIDNGVGGENSFFTMPDYQPTEWTKWKQSPEIPLDKIKINSQIYGEREIQVYAPASLEPLPVMYLQDGTEYLKRAEASTIQLNLVIAKKIKPFIMVFLDPKDRLKEYSASDDYAKFVATEVVPVIDAKYKTVKSRDGRAIIGASLGGITSVHVGLKYPEVFSKIGGQSSSFWVNNERVVKELEKLDANRTKYEFYFDDGTLEGVEDSWKVVEILKKKGFRVTYLEGEAGHNWTSWRDRLADAFVAFMN